MSSEFIVLLLSKLDLFIVPENQYFEPNSFISYPHNKKMKMQNSSKNKTDCNNNSNIHLNRHTLGKIKTDSILSNLHPTLKYQFTVLTKEMLTQCVLKKEIVHR